MPLGLRSLEPGRQRAMLLSPGCLEHSQSRALYTLRSARSLVGAAAAVKGSPPTSFQLLGLLKDPLNDFPAAVCLGEGGPREKASQGDAHLWVSSQNKQERFHFPKPEVTGALLLLFEESKRDPCLS